MKVVARRKSGLEKWQDGINRAVGDVKWNEWDCEVQRAVNEYNRHLSTTPGFRSLDWQLIKAMIWVETGAESKKWATNPMQIGNPGDPGLKALLSGREGGDLILPLAWQKQLSISSATTDPVHNIRAGTGYLLMRIANYAMRSVPGPDLAIYEVRVKAGDSMAKLAKAHGSTEEIMRKLNPTAVVLMPGQYLKYQRASLKKVIIGWKLITTSSIATYYNVGDSMYSRKLDYALALIRQGKAAVCAH